MIGHDPARRELERELPPVTLIMGPKSVGKEPLARHVAAHHGYQTLTTRKLSAEEARFIVNGAPRKGITPVAYLISLDGSTTAAQNILLKVLEEPPDHARFILLATRPPQPTVLSRSRIYWLNLLTNEQVADVLVSAHGVSRDEAVRVAPFGRGQVLPALQALENKDLPRIRSVVSAAVKAARATGSSQTLELAMRSWTPVHDEVLRSWVEEAAAGTWLAYAESFAPGVTREKARVIMVLLERYRNSRVAAFVALTHAFKEES